MQRREKWILIAIGLAGAWSLRGVAQDAPGPVTGPWRPIPEIPALLWYTEFDESADEAKRLFQNGDIVDRDPFKPTDDAAKKATRPPWQNDRYIALRKGSLAIRFESTKLRIPDKLNPNQIFILFNAWSSEPGKFNVAVRSGGDFSENMSIAKPNMWCSYRISFGALANGSNRMKADSLLQELRFSFPASRAGEKEPEVCLDKVVISLGPPDSVAQMLMAWRAKMGKLTKTVAADGLCYDEKTHLALQKLAQPRGRRGPALLFLPSSTGDGDGDGATAWNAAALEAKMTDVKFEAASDPRKLPLTVLGDVRAFLPFLVQKADAQAALLVITGDDGARQGKDVEGLRVLLERLLAARCVPLLCLPAANGADKNLAEFLKAAVKLCDELGVPYADQGFAFKGIPKPYEGSRLTDEGQKALRVLLLASYKHMHDALNSRR